MGIPTPTPSLPTAFVFNRTNMRIETTWNEQCALIPFSLNDIQVTDTNGAAYGVPSSVATGGSVSVFTFQMNPIASYGGTLGAVTMNQVIRSESTLDANSPITNQAITFSGSFGGGASLKHKLLLRT